MSDNSIETSKYRVDNSERKHREVQQKQRREIFKKKQSRERSEHSVEIGDV